MAEKKFEVKMSLLFIILISISVFLSLKSPSGSRIVIACAGDSLMRPIPMYLRRWLPRRNIIIKEWAQGGLSVVTYFSFFSSHPAWRQEKVDFILLQLGTNDVPLFLRNEENEELFISNFRKIIKEFRKLKSNYFRRPKIIVATAPPVFSKERESAEKNRLIEQIINPAIKQMAEKEKLFLLDQWPKFKDQPGLYDPDGIHLNGEGEKVMARQWSRIIRKIWLASKTKDYGKIFLEFRNSDEKDVFERKNPNKRPKVN